MARLRFYLGNEMTHLFTALLACVISGPATTQINVTLQPGVKINVINPPPPKPELYMIRLY